VTVARVNLFDNILRYEIEVTRELADHWGLYYDTSRHACWNLCNDKKCVKLQSEEEKEVLGIAEASTRAVIAVKNPPVR